MKVAGEVLGYVLLLGAGHDGGKILDFEAPDTIGLWGILFQHQERADAVAGDVGYREDLAHGRDADRKTFGEPPVIADADDLRALASP